MDNKELSRLLKTLRSNGVTFYKTPELEMNLHPDAMLLPKEATEDYYSDELENPYAGFPMRELTQEEQSYLAMGGDPGAIK